MHGAINFMNNPMLRAAAAGGAYFALVFAAGFLLGSIRVLIIIPRIGEAVAVGLELPIMLALSWIVCRRLIAVFDVAAMLTPRLVMGGLAFGILMLAEIGVSTLVLGRTVSEHFEQYRKLLALLGLAMQIAFAMFPAIQLVMRRQSQ